MDETMEGAVAALQLARRVVIFTGAGISAASGIPTFRDKLTGLWEHYDPEALETAKAFRHNSALVWSWYLWRRSQVGEAEPNAAHYAAADLAKTGRDVTVVTQNIDDLHERAGSENVIHLHGSLATPKCFACNRPAVLIEGEANAFETGDLVAPPRCKGCNGKLRPAVVWFGEQLPATAWKQAITAVHECDVLISIGTSGAVQPAASIPARARSHGAKVIHINLSPSGGEDPNDFVLIGDSVMLLPTLIKMSSTS